MEVLTNASHSFRGRQWEGARTSMEGMQNWLLCFVMLGPAPAAVRSPGVHRVADARIQARGGAHKRAGARYRGSTPCGHRRERPASAAPPTTGSQNRGRKRTLRVLPEDRHTLTWSITIVSPWEPSKSHLTDVLTYESNNVEVLQSQTGWDEIQVEPRQRTPCCHRRDDGQSGEARIDRTVAQMKLVHTPSVSRTTERSSA